MTALDELADALGVETRWRDVDGNAHTAADETLLAIVRMLGVDIASVDDAAPALADVLAQRAATLLEPVVVQWDGAPVVVPLRLRDGDARQRVTVVIERDDGDVTEWRATGAAVELPTEVPPGIHRLVVEVGARRDVATLIAAPSRIAEGAHAPAWGVFAPVYALHHRERTTTGDFGALGRLAEWTAERGAGVVGTLPLLATFVGHGNEPLAPSPYQPVSRRFWNESYIEIAGVEEPAPGALVDLAALAAARRPHLERAARAAPGPAFEVWLDRHPDVRDYAQFRSATEGEGDDAVRYHEFVQWQAEEQLGRLTDAMRARGQVLYLDLPVGAHPDGYDVVSQPDLFLRDASVGAPPDTFQPAGQDWGFPPVDPAAARRTGYRYLRACLDAHLRFARLLRIDHVMGLHRLWIVPRGAAPTEGAYVRYAGEEQWAVVCLAAAQHGAGIVGENLGTVPEATNDALERHGALGSWVAEFDAPDSPPSRSLAAVGTHDLPTFASWWHGLDPKRRGNVLEAMRRAETLDETYGDLLEPHEVLEALLVWMGSSPADVVMVALEDLWLEAEAQNEPGTQTHQNFSRRCAYGLDELDSLDHLVHTLDRLDAARRST